jgi:N-acetylmuramoyl-L-alanine amidase CwlA
MTSTLKKILVSSLVIGLFSASSAFAAGKTYTEDEFLDHFSGKTKKVVTAKLGAPVKKELSVKPTDAATVTGKNVDDKSSKPVKVEMWYYKNIVRYDPKRTYKETEITFVNDRVMNIAFFNNR